MAPLNSILSTPLSVIECILTGGPLWCPALGPFLALGGPDSDNPLLAVWMPPIPKNQYSVFCGRDIRICDIAMSSVGGRPVSSWQIWHHMRPGHHRDFRFQTEGNRSKTTLTYHWPWEMCRTKCDKRFHPRSSQSQIDAVTLPPPNNEIARYLFPVISVLASHEIDRGQHFEKCVDSEPYSREFLDGNNFCLLVWALGCYCLTTEDFIPEVTKHFF